jgi:membrane-associated protein
MLIPTKELVQYVELMGYIGLGTVVFIETGLFFGFIFPGDSLFFIAGMLAAKGFFQISILISVLFVAAVLGYFLGYWFGDRLGAWLQQRKKSLLFKPEYLELAQAFYHKHGNRTILLARIFPIVRTFAPIVSGMVKMPYAAFITYNLLGAALWVGTFTLSGYFLGSRYPVILDHLMPIVLLIVVVSLLPAGCALVKKKFCRG